MQARASSRERPVGSPTPERGGRRAVETEPISVSPVRRAAGWAGVVSIDHFATEWSADIPVGMSALEAAPPRRAFPDADADADADGTSGDEMSASEWFG